MKISILVLLVLGLAAAMSGILSQESTVLSSTSASLTDNIEVKEFEKKVIMNTIQTTNDDNISKTMSENIKPIDSSFSPLPKRVEPRPKTTGRVPHQQIGVELVPELNDLLYSWVFSLPDVEQHATISSLPGATGVWLKEGTAVAQPQAILNGPEFTHIHPDGSLHAPLPLARALEAVEQGWAERHPFATQRAGWDGLVMLYTPQTEADLEIIFQLIVESYNFITGQSENPSDYMQ